MICCTLLVALFAAVGTALRHCGLRPGSALAWRPDLPAPPPAPGPERFSWAARARSFAHAGRGLACALREEHNARLHLTAAVLVAALGFALHFSATEWARIVFAVALVFVAELLNTALEHLCDVVSPAPHPGIGKAKDVAAAAVLIAALAAFMLLATLLVPRLLTAPLTTSLTGLPIGLPPEARALCGG